MSEKLKQVNTLSNAAYKASQEAHLYSEAVEVINKLKNSDVSLVTRLKNYMMDRQYGMNEGIAKEALYSLLNEMKDDICDVVELRLKEKAYKASLEHMTLLKKVEASFVQEPQQ